MSSSHHLPLCGLKRKAGPNRSPPSKRTRVADETLHESDASSTTGSTDTEPNGSNASTPLTPLSPKIVFRHPSDTNKVHHCTIDGCSKSFNRPAKLEQHLRSHTNTRPFVCTHAACGKDFLRESHLKHHIKSAHTNIRDHVCSWEGCEKGFLTATRLRRHLAAHEGREQFTCTSEGCGQTFRKHSTLQAHVIKVHEGRKPYVCAFLRDDAKRCNAGFDTAAKLKDHEGRLHEVKRYSCTICSTNRYSEESGVDESGSLVVFPRYSALQEHVTTNHPPTCARCGLKCKSQATLKSHLEVIHGDSSIDKRRTHLCSQLDCGAGFTRQGNLNVHLRTVHGDKRFVCGQLDKNSTKGVEAWDGADACGSAFTSKARLLEHIKTAHLPLEPKRGAKPKKQEKRRRQKETSTLTRLTGSGYAEETGRHIGCLVPDCEWSFLREYDHEMHLQSHHGLADFEIQEIRMGNSIFNGFSLFRSCQGHCTSDNADELASKGVLDSNVRYLDDGGIFEDSGGFWLGDQDYEMINTGVERLHDEMEMQRLIHED